MVIYKYRLPFKEVSKVVMPKDATIIRVDGENGAIYLWAIVNPKSAPEERTFNLFKTGGEMPDDIASAYFYHGCGAIYIQMELMMYVFEKIGSHRPAPEEPKPFDWKEAQESEA